MVDPERQLSLAGSLLLPLGAQSHLSSLIYTPRQPGLLTDTACVGAERCRKWVTPGFRSRVLCSRNSKRRCVVTYLE